MKVQYYENWVKFFQSQESVTRRIFLGKWQIFSIHLPYNIKYWIYNCTIEIFMWLWIRLSQEIILEFINSPLAFQNSNSDLNQNKSRNMSCHSILLNWIISFSNNLSLLSLKNLSSVHSWGVGSDLCCTSEHAVRVNMQPQDFNQEFNDLEGNSVETVIS